MRRSSLLLCVLLGGCISPRESAEDAAGGAIGFYQEHLGPQWGFHCDFSPSCSEFGRQAVHEHGLALGTLMTADRLLRDHGLVPEWYAQAPGGGLLDPVSDNVVGDAARAVPAGLPAFQETPETDGDPLAFADRLFDQQEFESAALEYRRALFLGATGEDARRARQRLALCLHQRGRHEAAHAALAPLPERDRSLLEAVLYHEEGDARAAEACLEDDRAAARLLRGMFALERGDAAAAAQAFEELPEVQRELLLPQVERFSGRETRSPVAAGVLSAVLPGAGQAYAGRLADGLVALLINGIFIGGTVAAVHNEEPVTGAALGLVAFGFYAGNVYGGVNAATRFNRRERERLVAATRGALRAGRVNLGLVPSDDGGALALYLRF